MLAVFLCSSVGKIITKFPNRNCVSHKRLQPMAKSSGVCTSHTAQLGLAQLRSAQHSTWMRITENRILNKIKWNEIKQKLIFFCVSRKAASSEPIQHICHIARSIASLSHNVVPWKLSKTVCVAHSVESIQCVRLFLYLCTVCACVCCWALIPYAFVRISDCFPLFEENREHVCSVCAYAYAHVNACISICP